MFAPDLPLMRARPGEPAVAYSGKAKGGMRPFAGAVESILRPAADPEQADLPVGLLRVRQRAAGCIRGADRPAENPDPMKLIQVLQTDVQSLPAAHGESGDGPMVGIRDGAKLPVD